MLSSQQFSGTLVAGMTISEKICMVNFDNQLNLKRVCFKHYSLHSNGSN